MRFGEILGGRFQLEGLAGAGGMGAIFRAVDLQTGQHAAVKVLLAQDRSIIERFQREAATLETINHPGVVRFFGSGKTSDGELYLAMQWLDGQDLSLRIEQGVLSVDETLRLAKRVAEALAVVHERGIVHRDLKPSNILLVNGDVDRATVIDFGVALGQATVRATKTGTIVGTPAYMAPEQARGSRNLDSRVDVYSLACVIFECLTGHPPYGGEQPVAVLAKVLLEEAPRLASVRPDVPAWLDVAVAEMLSKDPALRPRTGAEAVLRLDPSAAPSVAPGPPRPSVMPMSAHEQNWVSIVLVSPDPSVDAYAHTAQADVENAKLKAVVLPFEGRTEPLADGAVVITFQGGTTALDRSLRAAKCALEVRACLPARRVALATGRAIAQRGTLPVGEVVDRAVRLLADEVGADVGVRVDDSSSALLGAAFRIENGFLYPDQAAPREGVPFVGRDRELDVLRGLCEDTVVDAVARAVIVSGPAGSGKTRIAQELAAVLAEMAPAPRIWRVRAEEISEGSALRVASQLVGAEVGIVGAESERGRKVEARVKSGAFNDAPRVIDFLKEMVGAGGEATNVELRSARHDAMAMGDQIQRAFCDLVADVCRTSSLVIMVEDAQWADRASMKLLDAALRIHENAPLVIVAFARPEMEERFPSLWEERSTTTLALAPLPKRARERLARHLLGPIAEEMIADIVDRSEGNPLVLCEMARAVREGRAQAMPDTAIAMMTARIEATPTEERQALRAASVFGERFWVAGVNALVGTDVTESIERLAGRELVTARADSEIENEKELAFSHALLRDAAYSMLTDEDKRTAHARAYEWLERVGERDVIVLGEHAERGGLDAAAAKLYARGAEYALEGIDLTGAIERAARAEKCGATGEALGELRRIQTEAYFWRGEQRQAADCGKQAMDLLPDGSSGWFQAAALASAGYARVSDHGAALEIVERMRSAPLDPSAISDRTAAIAVAAGFLALGGNIPLAEEMLREIKEAAARLSEREPAVFARVMRARAILAGVKAHSGAYLELSIRTADLFMRAGDLRNMSSARSNVAHAYIEHGAFEKAAEEAREALDAAERLGLRNAIALAKQNLGYALAMTGATDEGIAVLRDSASEYHAQGHKRMEGGSHIYLAAIELERDAQRALEEAETAILALGETPLAAYALALASSAALRLGDPIRALDLAEKALGILDEKGSIDAGQADVLLAAVEAYLATGDRDRATTVLNRARAWIMARAASVSNDALREALLRRVPAHARLMRIAL